MPFFVLILLNLNLVSVMFKWAVNVSVYGAICWLRFSLDCLKKPLKK
jgi:hypothetical protein